MQSLLVPYEARRCTVLVIPVKQYLFCALLILAQFLCSAIPQMKPVLLADSQGIKKLGSRTTQFGSGTTEPECFSGFAVAPERLILAQHLGRGRYLNSILAAGLNANGDGLLIPDKISWAAIQLSKFALYVRN